MKIAELLRKVLFVVILSLVGGVAFAAGLAWASASARAAETKGRTAGKSEPKVVYPKETNLDFEGLKLQGELRNPGEFYFQHRSEEKFDSLVKRRKNFHQEMLRDAVLSK